MSAPCNKCKDAQPKMLAIEPYKVGCLKAKAYYSPKGDQIIRDYSCLTERTKNVRKNAR